PEVAAEERGVEVLRHADAEEMPDADGEGAVPGEVEEEIHAERVHVADPREEPVMPSGRQEPLLVDERGDDELVEEALRNALDAGVHVGECGAPARRQRVEAGRETMK